MSETVKRYYISAYPGVGTPRLVEMSEQYQQETGALGLIKGEDYARIEQECERLRALLRSAQWCMQTTPSCQSGIVDICGCKRCVHRRIDAALSAKP